MSKTPTGLPFWQGYLRRSGRTDPLAELAPGLVLTWDLDVPLQAIKGYATGPTSGQTGTVDLGPSAGLGGQIRWQSLLLASP